MRTPTPKCLKIFRPSLAHVRVDFVAHAAGEKQNFQSRLPRGNVQIRVFFGNRRFGHYRYAPVADCGLHERSARRVRGVLLVAQKQRVERSPDLHQKREQLRVAKHYAKGDFLNRVKPHVLRGDFAGAHENVENRHPRRARALARAAEQAAVETFAHRLGVFYKPRREVRKQRELPARYVGLPFGFGEHGADRLACPAAHALDELVVERRQFVRKLFQVVHLT